MPKFTLDLNDQLCHTLYSTSNALIRAYRPLLAPLDLTYPQYIILLSLWQHDGVSVRTLSEHSRLDSGTIAPILQRLERKGMLTRKHAIEDERKKVISLTKKGKLLKSQAASIPEQLACKTDLTMREVQQLKKLCEQLFQSLTASDTR